MTATSDGGGAGRRAPRPGAEADRRAAAVAATAAAALLTLTVLVAAELPALMRTDFAVSEAARRYALEHPWWRVTMSGITHTGSGAVLTPLAVVMVAVLMWRRQRALALFVAVATVTGPVIRLALLHLVARERPVDRLTASGSWAFPSGHTTSSGIAAGVAIVLVLALLRAGWHRRALIAVAAGWAVLVGISRVALLAHWPADVVGGWLLTVAVIAVLSLVLARPAAGDRGAGDQDPADEQVSRAR
jgi:membrane-associated phospholipid phosphatase